MNFNPDFNQFLNQSSFDSVGDQNIFTALMISSDLCAVLKGMCSTDGLQETKSLNNGETLVDFWHQVSGPVDQRIQPSFTKMFRSVDMLADLLLSHDGIKSDCPHIDDGATFTSNISFNDVLPGGIIFSRDSFVYDYAGQGKSDTLGNAPIKATPNKPNLTRWEQMYAAKLLPQSVSSAATIPQSVSTAATNPASGASRKCKVETADLSKQSCLKPTKRNYVEPTENDVLFGRGGRSNHHPGNKRYHEEKLQIQPRYKAADRAATTAISLELVGAVRAWGGRFLKLEEGTKDRWYEVSKTAARKKASQALREVKVK